jgi:hypothetical protein
VNALKRLKYLSVVGNHLHSCPSRGCGCLDYELRFPQIFCPNLIEFGQVVVSEHLRDPPDQIKVGLPNCLSGQVDLINAYSQQLARIVSNSGKEFEGILIPGLQWVIVEFVGNHLHDSILLHGCPSRGCGCLDFSG